MKKIISVLLSLTIILLFSACSVASNTNDTTSKGNIENIVLKEVMHEKSTIYLEENGKGSIEFSNGNYYDVSWTNEEDTITVSYSTPEMQNNRKLVEETFENTKVWYDQKSELTYVKESDFENIKQSLKIHRYDTLRNEMLEQAEMFDWKKALHEYQTQPAKAKANYDNKIFTYTSVVRDIQSDYCVVSTELYNGLPVDGIQVYFISDEDLINLEVGKEISFVGEFIGNEGTLPLFTEAMIIS